VSARRAGSADFAFRAGTGFFALLVVVAVVAIGYQLVRQSELSLRQFGLHFWLTDIWDPVSGEFGARPFIWGTLYSSLLALILATPIALGIAIYISERSSPRSRRSSTAYGASSCWFRWCGSSNPPHRGG
jgi:phosphate transport system permease protein